MANAAAKTLLDSAAPGQFDVVLESIQKLGKDTFRGNWGAELKQAQDQYKCIGIDQEVKHPLAQSLREKLATYQEKTFGSKAGVTARVALLPGKDRNEIIIQTYAEKIDVANQYTGCWKAIWTITADGTSYGTTEGEIMLKATKAEIEGRAELHSYSYEEGNTQLQTSKVFPNFKIKVSKKSLATGIVEKIVEWEQEVLQHLADMPDMVGERLRMIRRVLPITKTRMKWDVVAHRNVKTLQATKPKKR